MKAFEPTIVSGVDQLPAASDAAIAFIDAWKDARNGRLVPRKRDFDPLNVPALLPSIWIYEHDPEADVFRCRLAGERVNDAWGGSIARKTSLEILGAADNQAVVAVWRSVLGTPLIHYGNEERLSGTKLYAAERVVMPLENDAGEPAFILGISLYKLDPRTADVPPVLLESSFNIPCRDL